MPEEVEQAISKALARVPADRYATAHAFQQALARGMRKSAQFRAIRQRRRFYALVSLGGIVAIAVIVQLVRGPGMRLEPNRVVVATFENQSGDPELATFGGIAQDWITQGLMASEDPLAPDGIITPAAVLAVTLDFKVSGGNFVTLLVVGDDYFGHSFSHVLQIFGDRENGHYFA